MDGDVASTHAYMHHGQPDTQPFLYVHIMYARPASIQPWQACILLSFLLYMHVRCSAGALDCQTICMSC
jgi:hypothetical protein